MSYKNAGPIGYQAKNNIYRKRRVNRRAMRRRGKFSKRVVNAIQNHLLEKANYHIVNTQRITTAVGQQAYSEILIQNSSSDINAIYGLIIAPVSGGQPSSTLRSMKFFINTYVAQTTMKNMTNVSCIVDMYECVPRFDTDDRPSQVWTGGIADQGDAGGANALGATPFMSNAFCVSYKVLKCVRYLLTGGACQHIMFKDKRNKTINYERLFSNSSNVAFKGLTRTFFACVRGEPIADATNPLLISTPIVSVDFITTETYYYSFAPQNVVQSQHSTTLGTITTAHTTTVQNDLTGVAISSS